MTMRKSPIIRVLAAGMIALFLAVCFSFPCGRTTRAASESRAECVVEVESRRILSGKNEDTPLPEASTTKILTAILILDDCDLDAEVTVPAEAEGVEGSSIYLRAGERYSVKDLLYGLMLRSGNDCAVALALYHSGSIEAFAAEMNEKAVLLGACDSRFVNPHGLPDRRHRTTARDLALISAYAMENETFREIVSCKYYAPRGWKNKNKMLWNYDGAVGIKTGFTLEAGRCLVTGAEREGMKLVCVVLDSPQMYERTAELLDGTYASYRMCELCGEGARFGELCAMRRFAYPLTDSERKRIRTLIERADPPPVRGGDFGGQMKIYLENNLLFSQNLYMIEK